MIEKIKIGKTILENPTFIGFASFAAGDGFLMIIESAGRKYAITLDGKIYDVIERGTQFFVEIPYGGRVYRAPLRFKL
jgi:hypothetical protein